MHKTGQRSSEISLPFNLVCIKTNWDLIYMHLYTHMEIYIHSYTCISLSMCLLHAVSVPGMYPFLIRKTERSLLLLCTLLEALLVSSLKDLQVSSQETVTRHIFCGTLYKIFYFLHCRLLYQKAWMSQITGKTREMAVIG